MVNEMARNSFLREVDEPEFDELVAGRGDSYGWQEGTPRRLARLGPGSIGVISVAEDGTETRPRPSVLVAREDELRRLFGRYSQLHQDLSPITAWCHVLTPRFIEPLDSLTRFPSLYGLEAAWAGLIVAETALVLEKPVSAIRIASCFATQCFAIARTNAIWNHISIEEIMERFNSLIRLLRLDRNSIGKPENRIRTVRTSMTPVYECLVALSRGRNSTRSSQLEPIIEALNQLRLSRGRNGPQEAAALAEPVLHYAPEAEALLQFTTLAPEMRLRLFDRLVSALNAEPERAEVRRNVLAMLAGYISTVAAGGASSLTIAEQLSAQRPEITAWAYMIGGIGENVVWTSSFDGLGRLVARELLRPLRLDDPPVCDFAFEEANVVVDSDLKDPLVHLRVKQSRTLSVALFPGVNLAIPLPEAIQSQNRAEQQTRPVPVGSPPDSNLMGSLADALWPHIQPRVAALMRNGQIATTANENARRNRDKKRTGSQGNLPLDKPKRF
jgi:hypothetical protein